MSGLVRLPSFMRNGGKFTRFQRRVAEEILRATKRELEKTRLDSKEIRELTLSVAFQVCAIIDGSAVIEEQQGRIVPVLTFSERRDEPDTLILDNLGVGSYMHEILAEIGDEVFPYDEG